ncbi:hypothetical protein B0T21DRAFT_21802 [Apiosordaria backusii]|uniref:Secreted protein n=1 Tax=Apiosordaria backusii TaxID=314023 RepID=A0AA40EZR3_9PEZI|nr:hypothetical protein B0T21DRAFT_21802 [Apiosordaria backusii]
MGRKRTWGCHDCLCCWLRGRSWVLLNRVWRGCSLVRPAVCCVTTAFPRCSWNMAARPCGLSGAFWRSSPGHGQIARRSLYGEKMSQAPV